MKKRIIGYGGILFAIAAAAVFFFVRSGRQIQVTTSQFPTVSPDLTNETPIRQPQLPPIADGPLKESVVAAGDYLVRQQLVNGELSYQVDVLTEDRNYSPSYVRLMAGAGALYTVCRVSGDAVYCEAGDRALEHYMAFFVADPQRFAGTCFYTAGTCPLGGAALSIDAIYKRWQATGSTTLKDQDLLPLAKSLGYFIVSMRKPEGGFYHSFDPHYGGTADPNYFVIYFPGESLLSLLELYEMTGDPYWLQQAHEVNDYMITQTVTEDHWHSYAFSMIARLDTISQADKEYAHRIADTIIAGQVRSLNPKNTSISTATKIEALASLAKAYFLSGEDHDWLDKDIRTFITFVQARQLPDNDCGWTITADMTERFGGGIFSACEDPSIRVDGVQHYINGVTAYLEYQGMLAK